MVDLVRVRDAAGNETVVGSRWLTRWPDDFTPVGEEHPADLAETDSPTGDEEEE